MSQCSNAPAPAPFSVRPKRGAVMRHFQGSGRKPASQLEGMFIPIKKLHSLLDFPLPPKDYQVPEILANLRIAIVDGYTQNHVKQDDA